jgi:hypothetical protein
METTASSQDESTLATVSDPISNGNATTNKQHEEIADDDLCPVCRLLLCNPVQTGCRHTLCKSCMATWADVSATKPLTIVSIDEQPHDDLDAVTGLEARCPMCRTQTIASLDEERIATLRSNYPIVYSEREAEEINDEDGHESVQTITLHIGNTHHWVTPEHKDISNVHQWTFFLKPSRTDIIEEVQIFLHPTFRPSRIIRSRPPFEVTRKGWGTFIIVAAVILKAGYSWVSSDAEDSPDGAERGMLRLEWMLDFSPRETEGVGGGSMGRCRLKVKSDRQWKGMGEEEVRDRAEWERVVRQYQRDGRYEPPDE